WWPTRSGRGAAIRRPWPSPSSTPRRYRTGCCTGASASSDRLPGPEALVLGRAEQQGGDLALGVDPDQPLGRGVGEGDVEHVDVFPAAGEGDGDEGPEAFHQRRHH